MFFNHKDLTSEEICSSAIFTCASSRFWNKKSLFMFDSQSRDEIGSSVPNEHSVIIELRSIENDMKIK